MKTILVLEDETVLRNFMAHTLRVAGHQVLEASRATEALELAAEARAGGNPIDLLIADVVMRGRGGVEVAEQLTGVDGQLSVLLISGYSEPPHRPRPGWEFLPKPFGPTVLLGVVGGLLYRPKTV
jgi:CheY-like chemotaxis protein